MFPTKSMNNGLRVMLKMEETKILLSESIYTYKIYYWFPHRFFFNVKFRS